MITVPTSQANTRFYTLPANLKHVILSEQTIDAIESVLSAHHIAEEKTPLISRIVGLVFLGFIHRDDVAKEVAETLHINNNSARDIAKALNDGLFSLYANDLDVIYSPEREEEPASAQPIPIAKPSAPPPSASPTIKPVSPLTFTPGAPKAGAIPVAVAPSPPSSASRRTTEGQAPPPTPSPVPREPRTNLPAYSPPTSPAMSQPNVPAPFVIHKEAEAQALRSQAGFKLELRKLFGDRKQPFAAQKPTAPPPRPAQIEIGKMPETPKASAIGKVEIAAPRVVHYNGLRTPTGVPQPAEKGGPAPLMGYAPKPQITNPTSRIIEQAPPPAPSSMSHVAFTKQPSSPSIPREPRTNLPTYPPSTPPAVKSSVLPPQPPSQKSSPSFGLPPSFMKPPSVPPPSGK